MKRYRTPRAVDEYRGQGPRHPAPGDKKEGPTKIGILPELTTKFIDYSKATQPLQDSDLSSGPTPSMLEKTRYIAPAVMVPILLVGAVSFIVWKMCQSDPPGDVWSLVLVFGQDKNCKISSNNMPTK
ncbi:hypothetical protein NDU88_001638 [Pleurodeles waltl]|uniref:Uncharacterized protein n=1 Tax=Pleurodeles waltl TaxID=8319 RepID=A0AAV7W241_PLEWA|nr:hypothetical protein NDU88_001638 [Pleurodeles waltl]